MKSWNLSEKLLLTAIEGWSIFSVCFLNQMITTVFPAYPSVQSVNQTFQSSINCTIENPSNIYVAILIGFKYCTEIIALPISGWISDIYDPPIILFCGALVEIGACVLYSLSGNFYVTLVARVVDAIGYSVLTTAGMTLIYTIYHKETSRNKVVTIDSILVYIAISVSPLMAGGIYESVAVFSYDWARVATFMSICPMFVILAVAISPFAFDNSVFSRVILRCLQQTPDKPEEKQMVEPFMNGKGTLETGEEQPPDAEKVSQTSDKEVDNEAVEIVEKSLNIWVLIRDGHVMIVILSLLCQAMIGNSLETTLPIFMIRKFCSDQKDQGSVWLFGLFSLVGFFLSSVLFHRKPQICWIFPMAGLIFTGLLGVTIYFADPWWVIGICLGIISFFSSMSDIILIPLVPKIIDAKYSKAYGSASGLTMLTFTISGTLGSFPVGPVVERFGFLILFIILCSFNVFMTPLAYLLRRYFK